MSESGSVPGSSPNKWFKVTKKKKTYSQPHQIKNGFEGFYSNPVVVKSISTQRKKILTPPRSKEFQYRPKIRLFPNRKVSKNHARGKRKVHAPEAKQYQQFSRKKRIVVKDSDVFFNKEVVKKSGGKKIIQKNQVLSKTTSLEEEFQKKKRIEDPVAVKRKKMEGKENKKISDSDVFSSALGFRIKETDDVSPFDPKMTFRDKELAKKSKKRIVDRDKERFMKDEENRIKNLPWPDENDEELEVVEKKKVKK